MYNATDQVTRDSQQWLYFAAGLAFSHCLPFQSWHENFVLGAILHMIVVPFFARRPDLPVLESSAQHVVLRQHHPGHR